MTSEEIRALQSPIKAHYRDDPAAAVVTLRSTGVLGVESISCRVGTARGAVDAGLHPSAGGDGSWACSGDMLLDALAACAGVTLRAVATALNIEVRSGTVTVEGDLDFRGTLGVDRDAPVGFRAIRLVFDLDTLADVESLATLKKLTERYCVVYQTLCRAVESSSEIRARQSDGVAPG